MIEGQRSEQSVLYVAYRVELTCLTSIRTHHVNHCRVILLAEHIRSCLVNCLVVLRLLLLPLLASKESGDIIKVVDDGRLVWQELAGFHQTVQSVFQVAAVVHMHLLPAICVQKVR